MSIMDIQIKDGTLTIKRTYSAPIAEVFDAWVETSKIKQWWGCAECTHVDSEVEPKLGGKYNHHMTISTEHGTHRAENFATLIEYDPPHRLSYRSPDEQDPMVITVTFKTVDAGTEVILEHANIPDMEVPGGTKLTEIIRGGWTAALGKLSVFLNRDVAA